MSETKSKEPSALPFEDAGALPFEMSLREKLVELRKACPDIVKKKHSENVTYKYAKIYDVWEKITPIMNAIGVDFDIVSEVATKKDENGNPCFWETMETQTRNGPRLMFLYEADVTIRWTNIHHDEEFIEVTIHAIGWNDDPAKAKGAAHTYALKYYLFEKFAIDQGEDDPDGNDFAADAKAPTQRKAYGLSEAQLARLYAKAKAAGLSKDRIDARIKEKYNKEDPAKLTKAEYEEICAALDGATQGGNNNA